MKIAIVQHRPVYLDLAGTLAKAAKLIQQAANQGADIVAFGETFFTGYPAWLDHCPNVALWEHAPTKQVFQRMYDNGLSANGEAMQQLQQLAAQWSVRLLFGANEVVPEGPAHGTIFNSIFMIDQNGSIMLHHRKLMPTYIEKLLYGLGDGHGLHAVNLPQGKIGALICWEHWMPLARQAMHETGEQLHFALWPAVHNAHQLASRHYAFEGRCIVVAVGQIMQASDIPEELEQPAHLAKAPDTYLLNGGSCVIGPDGKFILSPQFETEDIFYVDLPPLKELIREKLNLDISGHYNRADIFKLRINKERLL
ncbi:MAG: carbon-nitrogen hydrolase family protein [Saprospiraceae bacterium]|nr:carbon-nitrogen hydrolase family protein [Saprospiraceae bacterium]